MTEISVYIEGGGTSPQQRADLRQGFDGLFVKLKSKAREKRLGLKFVMAGSRNDACEAFLNAVRTKPDAINALLVDSEEEIASLVGNADQDAMASVAHLTQRDGWDLSSVKPERVHLMVQCMEAWIVADVDTLVRFYGQRFSRNALPARPNLEEEPKRELSDKPARATRETKKGEYHKINHAKLLLPEIDTTKVEKRCPHFAVFTGWLEKTIDAR